MKISTSEAENANEALFEDRFLKFKGKKTATDYISDIKDLLELANQEIKERNLIITRTL